MNPPPMRAGRPNARPTREPVTLREKMGAIIRKKREALGLTLDQVAERSGARLTGRTLHYCEHGERLTLENAVIIAMCLRLPMHEIMPSEISIAGTEHNDALCDAEIAKFPLRRYTPRRK